MEKVILAFGADNQFNLTNRIGIKFRLIDTSIFLINSFTSGYPLTKGLSNQRDPGLEPLRDTLLKVFEL